jgi:hydroxyacylglutathione hydrolase
MPTQLIKLELGPWPMNCYIIIDGGTGVGAIVDPGEDAEVILEAAKDLTIERILLTHGHPDHVGALDEVKKALNVPVHIHPKDASAFSIPFEIPLKDGEVISLGETRLHVVNTPGHTEGQCCFIIDQRVIVGDTIFVGGPGKTESPEDFSTTMETMEKVVFKWTDETEFFPGHGPSGTIGAERPAFEAFLARGWPGDLQGDVTWSEL